MIYKYTSVKRVIAKVFTDLDLQEGTHRIMDMIEWTGEALEKIGAFPSFISKVTGKDGNRILEVENYQTSLPHDFHSVIQVSYGTSATGPFYPMRYATGSFDFGRLDNSEVNTESTTVTATWSTSDVVTLAMDLYTLDYDAALAAINDDPTLRSKLNGILNLMSSNKNHEFEGGPMDTTLDLTYLINGGYLKTNQRNGYIMMAYQAVPTDADGYPLVPDDANFLEAIYWYIVTKLYYPQWLQGSLRDAVYYDARRSWNYYCKQAYGKALMPNADQLESMKNSWLRLKPELNEWATGFSTLGQSQMIYNN